MEKKPKVRKKLPKEAPLATRRRSVPKKASKRTRSTSSKF
ncbi:hypothetical protein CUMW_240000 [Citrus unshiu]|uniref:Uncharacterized protein n=1 Tax=Citrus unshiu TaxID=55188 RepID=A0A2H5QKZ8_CITUN|nr:hypothetical protein CUMW_239990 [Citrus unshiu]GAY65297.1 hypothetical protein CUMW_240000 [Citrus unshiu]